MTKKVVNRKIEIRIRIPSEYKEIIAFYAEVLLQWYRLKYYSIWKINLIFFILDKSIILPYNITKMIISI